MQVGDIISALLQPKNRWEVIKEQDGIFTLKSLISEREIQHNPATEDIIVLTPFEDGRQYDYENDKIYPPPFGREIKNANDLLDLMAYYKIGL